LSFDDLSKYHLLPPDQTQLLCKQINLSEMELIFIFTYSKFDS